MRRKYPRRQSELRSRLNGDEPVSTLTQDFHTRLDNLLRTLVHARPHFVRCLRSNASETPGRFDRASVMRQIRSLQVLETVNLMAGGTFTFFPCLILPSTHTHTKITNNNEIFTNFDVTATSGRSIILHFAITSATITFLLLSILFTSPSFFSRSFLPLTLFLEPFPHPLHLLLLPLPFLCSISSPLPMFCPPLSLSSY